MDIVYSVHSPAELSRESRETFLVLLTRQGQVRNPSQEKILRCSFLCLALDGTNAVGIGAIKKVYNSPFTKAGVPDLAGKFEYELGYLYVSDQEGNSYQGQGIGKNICLKLMQGLGNQNVWATTSVGKDAGRMVGVLERLGFVRAGNSFLGSATGKELGLFLKHKTAD